MGSRSSEIGFCHQFEPSQLDEATHAVGDLTQVKDRAVREAVTDTPPEACLDRRSVLAAYRGVCLPGDNLNGTEDNVERSIDTLRFHHSIRLSGICIV